MSDNANAPAPAAEPQGGSFQQAVHADQQQQVREERFRIVLLGVLIVFVLGYMTWIYSSIKQFDAGELTRIAGLKVEGQIPEIKKQMRTVALDNADQVTDRLKDLLLSAPAELRRTATAEAKAHLHQAAQDLGKQLGDKLVEDFRANVDHMYAKSPNEMSPDERLDAFVTQFRKNFVKVSDALLEQHSGPFSSELGKLRKQLERYRTGPLLRPEDEITRDIIAISVIYVDKHHRLIEHDDGTKTWAEKQARAAAQRAAAVKEAAKKTEPALPPQTKTAAME